MTPWWREEIGLGVLRCPLPSLEQVLFNSDWDMASPRCCPASVRRWMREDMRGV